MLIFFDCYLFSWEGNTAYCCVFVLVFIFGVLQFFNNLKLLLLCTRTIFISIVSSFLLIKLLKSRVKVTLTPKLFLWKRRKTKKVWIARYQSIKYEYIPRWIWLFVCTDWFYLTTMTALVSIETSVSPRWRSAVEVNIENERFTVVCSSCR